MSFYLEKGAAGALSTGFLQPRFSVVDINPEAAVKGNTLDQKAVELMEQRWKLLSQLRDANRKNVAGFGTEMAGYTDFYDTAHRLLTDSRWPEAFQISKEDKERYGNNSVGVSAILARNILAADGGTHYIHLCHPGWDHHVAIWDKKAGSNHYTLSAELDPALTSLMEEARLYATGSKRPGFAWCRPRIRPRMRMRSRSDLCGRSRRNVSTG